MGDNNISCPLRAFPSSDFPSPNLNMFNTDSQSSKKNDENNIIEKKNIDGEEKRPASDVPANTGLLNGHSKPDGVDIPLRNNSVGELLGDAPHLPDTELVESSKDGDGKEAELPKNDLLSSGLGQNSLTSLTHKKTEEIKNLDDALSQDIFGSQEKEESKPPSNPDSSDKNESSNGTDNHDADFSEGFDLHLSETQSFLPSSEKDKSGVTLVSESEDSNALEEESNDKVSDANDEKVSDDVEMSNESSNNIPSNSDASVPKETKNDVGMEDTNDDSLLNKEEESTDSDEQKPSASSVDDKKEEEMEVCETDGTETNTNEDKAELKESVENKEGELVENTAEENQPSEEEKEESLDSSSEPKEKMNLEEEKTKSDDVSLEENVDEESKEGEEEKKEENNEDELKEDEKEVKAAVRTSGRARKQSKKMAEATKKEVAEPEEKKVESMEIENEESETSVDDAAPCSCQPGCHQRIEKVSRHLTNACSQLDSFIKQKRRDENKLLKGFLDMLKEIQSISQNKKVSGESKISEHILIPEETPPKRKSGVKRKSSDADTPLKETPRKRMNIEEKSAKKADKKSNVDFKDLKGLAVFAKWPNSGWYYPGKVEELSGSDWKDATNVTVKFYDGLVREMKNINILPAYLIPPGSMLCDLDDETEMVVLSCDGSNQNSVDFKLSTKDSSGREVELNFNKLAIRANNMKIIKQQLEPTTDVVPKKMHMVSLDNLVSGRRSRGRSKKEADSEEKTTPTNQTERRSAGSSSSTPSKKSTPRRARN